jgi:hypothetical protein
MMERSIAEQLLEQSLDLSDLTNSLCIVFRA